VLHLQPLSMKKRVNIIGAGISGLCAGCYLQMNGFEVQIFEKHSIPGGLCTSWKKGEYTVDGSIHWILGSDDKDGFFDMWNEILDVKKIPFYNHEIRLTLEVKQHADKYGSKTFILYTNLDKLQAYMLDLSPEDEHVICRFIQDIRDLQQFRVPPIMDKLPFFQSLWRGIKMMRYLKFLFIIMRQTRISNFQLAKKFKSPFLREVFENMFDNDEVKMLVFNFPMASFDQKSAGYPIGGSLKWAERITEKFESLGGIVHYNTPVKRIITENNIVKALEVRNNVIHDCDIVLSSADWYRTVFEFLDGKYVDEKIIALKEKKSFEVYFSILLVTFGLKRDYKEYPHFNRFPIEKELHSPCGKTWDRLETHFYHYDPTLAPAGKTVMACSFYTKNGQYWIDLRKNDRKKYREVKNQFISELTEILELKYPGIKDDIEMVDFATPATVFRYTNNWQGSAQGWLPGDNVIASTPVKFKLPGLQNFYYASHWSRPGGGIPVAINMARDVTKVICNDHKMPFHTKQH
jgi:phytoene dehydrogenase-like protein